MLCLRYFLTERLLTSKRIRRFRDPGTSMLLAPDAKANAEEVEVEDDRGRCESSQHYYTGTLGTTHVRSTSATKTPKRSTVRVRFETQIGVGRTSACPEPTQPADLFSCLITFSL